MLKIENLTYRLKGRPIVENINTEIHGGELIGIVGPNGAGKTTLLKNICNILRPAEGKVLIEGKNIHGLKPAELSRKLCYLPQSIAFNFPFKVSEVVLMGRYPYLKRMENERLEDYGIARKSLEMVDMIDFMERDILTLSGGEQQRVSLSRVIAQDTDFLFLDEPLSNLDINHQLSVMDLLRSLSGEGKAVTVVLHDLRLASRYCTKLLVLNRGKLVAQGEPSSVLDEDLINEVFKVRSRLVTDGNGIESLDLVEPL